VLGWPVRRQLPGHPSVYVEAFDRPLRTEFAPLLAMMAFWMTSRALDDVTPGSVAAFTA
jgi:hypothetical protein